MNSFTDTVNEIIEQYFQEYGNERPKISIIQENLQDDMMAYFLREDLYNGNYVLYADMPKLMKNRVHGEAVLYHELTYVLDSLTLRKLLDSFEKFQDAIYSISEFHAAQIEMLKRLQDIKIEPECDILIPYKNMHIEAGSFIEQTIGMVLDSFDNLTTDYPFHIQVTQLFYLFGYTSALKMKGLVVEYSLDNINPLYRTHCNNLKNLFLTGEECRAYDVHTEFLAMYNIFAQG